MAGTSAGSFREDAFEDVACQFRLLGDDEDPVLVAAPGGADVEAAVAGRLRDHGEADVDGVALVAVGGGGVDVGQPAPSYLSPTTR